MAKNKLYAPLATVINPLLDGTGIVIGKCYQNSKASEYYVEVTFAQDNGFKWSTVIPYIYRRSNLRLDTDTTVIEYLKSIKKYFTKEAMDTWKTVELKKWEDNANKRSDKNELVTIEFFKKLLSFTIEIEMPENPNPQRRFQDIKDRGYVVSIFPIGNKKWGKILVPIPLNAEMGYEVFSKQFKSRVIRLFQGVNAYESKKTPVGSLIPDHKFSEVRWDDETKGENPENMSDEDIINKFQLLDNQRNLKKREVCRICAQTGKRGVLYGIDYYPSGGPIWNPEIPQKGKEAEKGCIGCPWYDIQAWKKAVSEKLKGDRHD